MNELKGSQMELRVYELFNILKVVFARGQD